MLIAALYLHSTAVLAAEQNLKPLSSIEVAPKDVMSVQALIDSRDALSERVIACFKAGGKPEVCPCQYPQERASLKKVYASLIEHHPHWKDQLLSYRYVNQEGRNIGGTLDLRVENFRRQLERLKCE
jgi:hypothetical protein